MIFVHGLHGRHAPKAVVQVQRHGIECVSAKQQEMQRVHLKSRQREKDRRISCVTNSPAQVSNSQQVSFSVSFRLLQEITSVCHSSYIHQNSDFMVHKVSSGLDVNASDVHKILFSWVIYNNHNSKCPISETTLQIDVFSMNVLRSCKKHQMKPDSLTRLNVWASQAFIHSHFAEPCI